MSGEQRQKQLKDYTEEVAKLVPEYVKPIEEGKKVRDNTGSSVDRGSSIDRIGSIGVLGGGTPLSLLIASAFCVSLVLLLCCGVYVCLPYSPSASLHRPLSP